MNLLAVLIATMQIKGCSAFVLKDTRQSASNTFILTH